MKILHSEAKSTALCGEIREKLISLVCDHIDVIPEIMIIDYQHIFMLASNIAEVNNLREQIMIDLNHVRGFIAIVGSKEVHSKDGILLNDLGRIMHDEGKVLVDVDVASEHMMFISQSREESSFLFVRRRMSVVNSI